AGACTIFPGSTHVSGEPICWEQEGDPSSAGDELITATTHIACAALFARHWPTKGKRHRLAQVIGGLLARCAWPLADTKLFTEVAAVAAGDLERLDRIKAAADAAEAYKAGKNAFGLPELAKLTGDIVTKQIGEWLKVPAPAVKTKARAGK